MISSISPLMAAFCISGVLAAWKVGSLEGRNISEFRGGVRMVVVPAGAIVGVDSPPFFHISSFRPCSKNPILSSYETCYVNPLNTKIAAHIGNSWV